MGTIDRRVIFPILDFALSHFRALAQTETKLRLKKNVLTISETFKLFKNVLFTLSSFALMSQQLQKLLAINCCAMSSHKVSYSIYYVHDLY